LPLIIKTAVEERDGHFFMPWLLDGSKVFAETWTSNRLSFTKFISFNKIISYLASRCYQNVSNNECWGAETFAPTGKTGARVSSGKRVQQQR